MILSVVIINRSLGDISDYINTLSSYNNIEFIIIDNYSSVNEFSENINLLNLDTNKLQKSDVIDYINGENILFFDDEILELEKIETIIEEIQKNNSVDILLFRNSFEYNINPYIEYNNLILCGKDFFGMVVHANISSINVYDFLENNFFVKIFKREFLLNLGFNYLYTIIFDISIFLEAKSVKYIDNIISKKRTNYYSSLLDINVFKDINHIINIHKSKLSNSITYNFINIYSDSLANYFVYKYNKKNDLYGINFLKTIIKEQENYFLLDLHIDNNKLYSNLTYNKRTEVRPDSYVYNIYYIMDDNKDDYVINKIETIVSNNTKQYHILLFDSIEDYNFNRDIFNEVYDLKNISKISKKYLFLYKLFGLKYMSSDRENKHNIFIYTENKAINYTIKENTDYDNDDIDDNNKYGNSKKIRFFADYNYKCYSHMEPSLYTGRAISPDSIDSIYPTATVFSDYRYDTVKSRITRPVFKIGPYINYCDDFIHNKLENKINDVFGKVLLIMPAHTTTNTDYENFDISDYINYIEYIKSKYNYDTVLVCAYNNDIYKGLLKEYEREDWYIVTGGNIYGEFFYNRLKTIINLSDYTISNKSGTHVGCCLFLNKPHTIYQSGISVKRHSIDKKYEVILNELTINQKFEEIIFNKLLSDYNENITDEQYRIFNMYYGFDKIKTKDEIRFILDFSKKMYFSCIDEINKIVESNIDLLDRKIEIDSIYYKYVLNYLENNKDCKYYSLVFESMCDLEKYLNI